MKTLEERLAVIETALGIDKVYSGETPEAWAGKVPVIYLLKEQAQWNADGVECLRQAMAGVEEHLVENGQFVTWAEKHLKTDVDDEE